MATKVKIKNLSEGYQSIITNGKHSIIGDEPIKSKGTDLGFSPSDLMLSGLALCKVATIRYIARKKGWDIGDVVADLSQSVLKTSDGIKTHVQVQISIEGDLSEAMNNELLHEADHCYIHRQIMGDWTIEPATLLIDTELASTV